MGRMKLIQLWNQRRPRHSVAQKFTKYAMYGPRVPTAFEKMTPHEMPVWRRHVGYVSIDWRLTAKNVIEDQNLIIIVKQVAPNCHSLSAAAGTSIQHHPTQSQKSRETREREKFSTFVKCMARRIARASAKVCPLPLNLRFTMNTVGMQNTAAKKNDSELVRRRPSEFPVRKVRQTMEKLKPNWCEHEKCRSYE